MKVREEKEDFDQAENKKSVFLSTNPYPKGSLPLTQLSWTEVREHHLFIPPDKEGSRMK
jgi:hypothetical protein